MTRCKCAPSNAPPALTVAQAAERLQVSEVTLYRALRTGAFPGCRVGVSWRIDPAAIDRMFAPTAAKGTPRDTD